MSIKFGWFDVPLNGDPSRYSYSADEMRHLWKSMLTNGIVPNIRKTENNTIIPEQQLGNSLMATPGQDLNVVINEGIGWIDGAYCIVTEPETISLQAGWINDIVLRLDLTGSEVFMGVIAKRRSAATIERGLIREGGIYELGLHSVNVPANAAQITQAMIIDYRLNMRVGTDGKPCCGIIGSLLMPDIDEWHQSAIKKMNEFLQSTAKILDDFTVEQKRDFNSWFLTLQGVLSGDIAGNLANQVLQKQNKTDNKLKTTNKEIVGAINELSDGKQNNSDDELKTVSKNIVGGINEVNAKVDTLNKDIEAHAENKSIHGSNINYNASAAYGNNIYKLTLDNAPLTLPTNYSVNFTAPANVKDGAKVVVINPNKYLDNKHEKTLLNGEFTKSVDSIIVTNNGYINLKTILGNRNAEIKSNIKAKDILKPNTDYTLILDIKDKRSDCWLYVNILSAVPPLYTKETYTSQSGIVKLKLTTRNEVDNADLFHFKHTAVNDKEQYNCEFKAWLVEGDYTNKNIKITDKDELILASDCEEYPILTYGENSPQIEDNAFIKGQPITLNVGLTGAFFKSGGGGGGSLPSTWIEKSNGIAMEPIKKHDAIIHMKYGNMDTGISPADTSGINVDKTIEDVAWSHDGSWLALRDSSRKMLIYQVEGDTYTLKKTISNVCCFSFAKASNYFVVLKENNTFDYYMYIINFYLESTTPNATCGMDYNTYCLDIQLSSDGTEVLTSSYEGIKAFKRNTDKKSFDEISIPQYNKTKPHQISLSKDGMYLMAFSERNSSDNKKNVYKKTNGTWSLIQTLTDLDNVYIYRTAIHPMGDYIFAAERSSGNIFWYQKHSKFDYYTKMPQPTIAPSNSINCLEVSPCGNYLVVGCTYYLHIYKIQNDALVKMADATDAPKGGVYKNSIKFKNDGSKLAVGMGITPFLHIYKTQEATLVKKLNSLELANCLATNKLFELGIGKANTNAEVNQNCNVTLIKGINDHLGGIYA